MITEGFTLTQLTIRNLWMQKPTLKFKNGDLIREQLKHGMINRVAVWSVWAIFWVIAYWNSQEDYMVKGYLYTEYFT